MTFELRSCLARCDWNSRDAVSLDYPWDGVILTLCLHNGMSFGVVKIQSFSFGGGLLTNIQKQPRRERLLTLRIVLCYASCVCWVMIVQRWRARRISRKHRVLKSTDTLSLPWRLYHPQSRFGAKSWHRRDVHITALHCEEEQFSRYTDQSLPKYLFS